MSGCVGPSLCNATGVGAYLTNETHAPAEPLGLGGGRGLKIRMDGVRLAGQSLLGVTPRTRFFIETSRAQADKFK